MSTAEYRSRNRAYMCRYAKLNRSGYRLLTDALGSRRRIQAMMAIGYTATDIASHSGVSKSFVRAIARGYRTTLHRSLADAISRTYDQFCTKPKFDTNAKRIKGWAKRFNYAPPMAWDDIDNPADYPKGVVW